MYLYCDFDSPTYIYQPEKAASLLEEKAGYYLRVKQCVKNRETVAVIALYNVNNAVGKEIAELLQDDFKKIGVALTVLGKRNRPFR